MDYFDSNYLENSIDLKYSNNDFKNYLDFVFKKLKSKEENKSKVLYLLSSRGSFPLLYSISDMDNQKKVDIKGFEILSTIYSVKNLYVVTGVGQSLKTRFEKEFLDLSYNRIIKNTNDKLSKYNLDEYLLSDWDEVITGTNLNERIKVYSKLNLKGNPLEIYSFIGNNGNSLNKRINQKIRSSIKKSQNKLLETRIILNELPWSDDEDLYKQIGLEYSPIGLLDISALNYFLRPKAIPKFLDAYIAKFNEELSSNIGIKSSLMNKLVLGDWSASLFNKKSAEEKNDKLFGNGVYRTNKNGSIIILDDIKVSYLFNHKKILRTSFKAFRKTLLEFEKENIKYFKFKNFLYSNKYYFKSGNCYFYDKKRNDKKYSKTLIRIINDNSGEEYKNPYLLIFKNIKGNEVIKNMEKMYGGLIEENGNEKN